MDETARASRWESYCHTLEPVVSDFDGYTQWLHRTAIFLVVVVMVASPALQIWNTNEYWNLLVALAIPMLLYILFQVWNGRVRYAQLQRLTRICRQHDELVFRPLGWTFAFCSYEYDLVSDPATSSAATAGMCIYFLPVESRDGSPSAILCDRIELCRASFPLPIFPQSIDSATGKVTNYSQTDRGLECLKNSPRWLEFWSDNVSLTTDQAPIRQLLPSAVFLVFLGISIVLIDHMYGIYTWQHALGGFVVLGSCCIAYMAAMYMASVRGQQRYLVRKLQTSLSTQHMPSGRTSPGYVDFRCVYDFAPQWGGMLRSVHYLYIFVPHSNDTLLVTV